MVKVIKKDPSAVVKKRKVCEHCGATLEYVPNDVLERSGKDISGGPDGCKYIVCPNCGKTVILKRW